MKGEKESKMAMIELGGYRRGVQEVVKVRIGVRKHLLDRCVKRAAADGREVDEVVEGALLEYLEMCDEREGA